jgi:O-acetylserine/cysteine efflux transporter
LDASGIFRVNPLIVELLSLFTALCYGASSILARKGMKDSNPMTGVVVGSLVQAILLAILVIAEPPDAFSWTAVGLFVASGILASTLGRLFNFMSIDRFGVALAASIIGSSPLFSTLLAAVFLGEKIDAATLFGTILVVAGIAVVRSGGQAVKELRSNALVLPLASAIFYGASSVTRKAALNILPESSFGALVGAIASLTIYSTYLLASRRTGELRVNWGSGRFWVVNGVVVTLAWLSMFTALTHGKVSVVSALGGTNPLFSIILGALLLKGSEELNSRIVVGSLAIVAGAMVITLF